MKKIIIIAVMLIVCFSGYCYAGLNDGLMAYYPFNGNCKDESGNGNHGTCIGVLPTKDRFGNANSAYEFINDDGENAQQYITIPDSPDLRPESALTLAAWVKRYPGTLYSVIISKNIVTEGQCLGWASYVLSFAIGEARVSGFTFQLLQNFDVRPEIGAPFSNMDNVWTHVAGVWGDNYHYMHLYINGEVASYYHAPLWGPLLYDNTTPVVIGGADNTDAVEPDCLPNFGWHGIIDDVRIYNRALSDSEIKQLYNDSDADGDGVLNTADNCPQKTNGYKLGSCSPWSGSPGGSCTSDNDCTASPTGVRACNKNQEDTDKDGVGDVCDNCYNNCNSLQKDADRDGIGDVCDLAPGCGGCGLPQCEQQC